VHVVIFILFKTNSCTLFNAHPIFTFKTQNTDPTSRYIGHTHTHIQTTYSNIPDKQLDEANKRKCSSGTKHERRPPEDGQTVMTETYRVLIMCFKKHF
jgi:hypothetical protein